MDQPSVRRRVKAVYHGGALHPLEPLPLSEDEQVEVTVEPAPTMKAQDVLELAAHVYRGLGEQVIAEVEAIALDRQHFSRHPA